MASARVSPTTMHAFVGHYVVLSLKLLDAAPQGMRKFLRSEILPVFITTGRSRSRFLVWYGACEPDTVEFRTDLCIVKRCMENLERAMSNRLLITIEGPMENGYDVVFQVRGLDGDEPSPLPEHPDMM